MRIPGFIDLQVNGYKGVDFSASELTYDGFIYACKELIKKGTVGFLPSIITSPDDIYRQNLRIIADAMKLKELKPYILGVHLEGPFITDKEPGAMGAHNVRWVKKADTEELGKLCEWSQGNVKLLTMAAEIPGADKLCKYAVKKGITVSLGHQMAADEDMKKLAKTGAKSLTHLGNALPKLLPRHENPIWAGLGNDALTAMIITDGHHIPPYMIKTIVRTKGIDKIVVVSDASPIAGLKPGKYTTLGNDVVLKKDGFLYNPKTGFLVGSSSTMMECANFLLSLNLLTPEEIVKVCFYNPLKLINVSPEKIKINNHMVYDKRKNKIILQ